jgi:hypothetical protein
MDVGGLDLRDPLVDVTLVPLGARDGDVLAVLQDPGRVAGADNGR